MTTHATIATQIAQLPDLPMKNLWAMWDEFFGQRPGHHHRIYIESRLAYKLQERAFGSLSSTLRRRLEKIGETGEVPNQKRRSESQLAPGTVMVREYKREIMLCHSIKFVDGKKAEGMSFCRSIYSAKF